MLEIKINYACIRLCNTYSRALRFVQHLPIERLKLVDKIARDIPPDQLATLRKRYVSERRSVRHLFQQRDKEGKLRWASSWASVTTVEGRLREVVKKEDPANPDLFLYTMYSDLSGTVHGRPGSLNEMFYVSDDGRLVVKTQPERQNPRRHLFGALVTLMWTIDALATDARLRKALGPERASLVEAVKAHRRRNKTSA
jgi:hypothetical protein